MPGAPVLQQLLVHRAGSTVHVLWYDGAVRRQHSIDGRATWLPAVGGRSGAASFATQPLVGVAGDGATLLYGAQFLQAPLRSSDSRVGSVSCCASGDIEADRLREAMRKALAVLQAAVGRE